MFRSLLSVAAGILLSVASVFTPDVASAGGVLVNAPGVAVAVGVRGRNAVVVNRGVVRQRVVVRRGLFGRRVVVRERVVPSAVVVNTPLFVPRSFVFSQRVHGVFVNDAQVLVPVAPVAVPVSPVFVPNVCR